MKYKAFMVESNRIEGEDRLNPGDIEALELALLGIKSLEDILTIHKILGTYLNQDWVGKLRQVDVRVGSFLAPSFRKIPLLMEEFLQTLGSLDSWKAHNVFEKIHPFQDLNGRTGRLIWLSKAIHEGYDYSIPFLQAYYYQTLNKEQYASLP